MFYNFLSYLILLYIINVLFTGIVALFIYTLDKKKVLSLPQLYLISAAIAPSICSLLIYYLLILIPKQSSLFYVSVVFAVFTYLLIIGRKNLHKLRDSTLTFLQEKKKTEPKIFLFIASALTIFFLAWQIIVVKIPIIRHDTFEYGTWGKVLSERKQINYSNQRFDPTTGFYFVGLHGMNFPIFGTWERFWNDITSSQGDYYFRSVTGWYWIIIVLELLYWLMKKDKVIAFIAATALVLTPAFGASLLYYHLDTYRIAFLVITLSLLLQVIEKPNRLLVLLFGISGGFMANAHSLGFALAGILFILYGLFSRESIKNKIINLLIIGILILVFGAVHYLFDILFGDVWVTWLKLQWKLIQESLK